MSGVPAKIRVGRTTYVHFRSKHKDYYVPDFLANPELSATPVQSPHVWRYTVSPAHHNTVFFYNALNKRSVWVLPIVHEDGSTEELGDGEAMEAIHGPSSRSSEPRTQASEEREAAAAAAATTAIPASATATSAARAAEARPEPRRPEQQSDREGDAAVPLDVAAAVASVKPSANVSAEAPADDGHVSRERVQAAVQRAQRANPLTISIGAGASTPGVSSSDNHSPAQPASLQQRLAAWRAKHHQSPFEVRARNDATAVADHAEFSPPRQQTPNTQETAAQSRMVIADPLQVDAANDSSERGAEAPEKSTGLVTTSPPQLTAAATEASHLVNAVSPASPKASSPPPATTAATTAAPTPAIDNSSGDNTRQEERKNREDGKTRVTTTKHTDDGPPSIAGNAGNGGIADDHARIHEKGSSPSCAVRPQQQDAAATRARLAQEKELARVAALLHCEKVRAMEQERTALECRRRALAVEQQEAAERARMAEARAAAAQQRREAEDQLADLRRRQQQLREENRAAEVRLCEVNQYAMKHAQMEAAAEATVADTSRYASRIAALLAAAAPKPDEVNAALQKSRESTGKLDETTTTTAATVKGPAFREHYVGRAGGGIDNAPTHASPFRVMQHNVVENAGPQKTRSATATAPISSGGAVDSAPAAPTRTHECICYGVPFFYDGEVVDYKPARSFVSNAQATLLKSKLHAGALLSKSPALLTAKRDGAGTEFYDAEQQYFFTGSWRDDKRDGAGVLSLPSSAVQGHWDRDQLTGSAVVQTKRAKANATFTAVPSSPSAAHTNGVALRTAAAPSTKTDNAKGALPLHHVALTGNAVVELNNKALFVGSLKDSRVAAPYILQLGEGDYIEWLGATPSNTTARKKKRGGPMTRTKTTTEPKPDGAGSLFESDAPPRTSVVASLGKDTTTTAAAAAAGTGECRVRFHNGDTYVGHVRNFQLHGMGYYRFAADGQSYTGAFQHGLPHGAGLMIFANGDLYKGHFVKGVFDGVGSYACKAGEYVYEGDWVAGTMSGEGTLLYANGDVWRGVFRDNARVSGAYTRVA